MTTKNDAIKMWQERIAAIDEELEENTKARKVIIEKATVGNRAERKELLSRKGKVLRALKAVEDDLDAHPLEEMGE